MFGSKSTLQRRFQEWVQQEFLIRLKKRYILVDRRGAPVVFVIASAETHDSKLLFPNLKKFRILRNSKALSQGFFH
ncbi:hypothetical protein LEP1GSC175_1727 [Leptospira santarosai str. HAI821]|nr:hypothetical protein LEP1GSC175_1727 [Leptospira santarosai str. HAI821]